jgi:pilus assembly protein Flp/PilA
LLNFLLLFREEEGATAVEYALIATLIAMAILGALTLLGSDVGVLFGKTSAAVEAAP